MSYRRITHQIELPASPQHVFKILHTPSAIRKWWSVSNAIVIANEDGLWCATWGEKEDEPDYISAATIKVFDPPRRMLLVDPKYFAKGGALPFKPEMTIEFIVEPMPAGSLLKVIQDKFPADSIADEFYAGCVIGWKNTFEAIKKFVEE